MADNEGTEVEETPTTDGASEAEHSRTPNGAGADRTDVDETESDDDVLTSDENVDEESGDDVSDETSESSTDTSDDGASDQEYTTLRGRIAAGLRESSPLGRLRDFIFPLLTLVILAFLLVSFRTILLPFIFACILVYLMEPVVRRIGRRPDGSGYVPRWVAVILVYLLFIGSVSTFSILVIPRFVTEIIRFAETVPDVVQDFRENQLPGIDADVQEFLRSYLPANSAMPDYVEAHQVVANARLEAARQATAFGAAQAVVGHAASTEFRWNAVPARPVTLEDGSVVELDDGAESVPTEGGVVTRRYEVVPPGEAPTVLKLDDALASSSGWVYESNEASSIKFVPTDDGGVEVFLRGMALEVEQTDEKVWTVRETARDEIPVEQSNVAIEQRFNLQRTLDEIIGNLVTTSNARIASVIEFAQKIVLGVVGGFVAIVLTFMVAAFISIDLPRVMSFLRSLVPERAKPGYDVLLTKMDRGLAGVVRGQLMICLVNGVLTYIGLLILDVKFSVLLAVVAGVLSLIPVFGTIISTVPIVAIGLTDGLFTGLLALGWILLIHFVEANILNPKIIGSSAHIHPVIVIFALLAGESTFGLVGALLAVPTASILLTLFEFVRTRAWREGLPEGEGASA
jgi:predicted PurR-regulated permease PerM